MKKVLSLILTITMLCSLFAIPVSAEDAYAENKVWFDLNGNSKLFMDSTSTDFTNMLTITNYLPGLDFGGVVNNPTGVFGTDKAGMSANADKLGCLPYSINKGTTPAKSFTAVVDFKSVDENIYWTINNVDYLVKPTEKIIKLVAGPVTTNLENSTVLDAETKADYIKRYASLTEFTLDVEDGNYTNISFLAALSNTYSRNVEVTFVYEDSTEKKSLTVTGTTINGKTWAEGGIFYHRMKEDSASIWGSDWHDFRPYTISPDSSKVLKEVKLTPVLASGSYRYPIYIISAWGEGKSIETLISELSDLEVTDAESAAIVKAKLNEIDIALNRINQVLNTADKAIHDAKAELVAVYEKEIEAEKEKEKLEKTSYADIPFGSGANSHIFEPQGQTVDSVSNPTSTIYTSGSRDYINDYMQSYWYNSSIVMGLDATDTDSHDENGNSPFYTWDHFPIYYRTSTSFSGSYLTLDANSSWTVPYLCEDGETVKYLPYKIDTSKKIIKLVGPWNSTYQKLTEKAKVAYSAKNTALRSATIDITNDTFKNIYILASKGHYQTNSTAPENFTADVYYEGTEAPVNVKIGIKKANVSASDAELASVTSIFNKITNNTTNTSSWQYPSLGYAANSTWYSYEIPCDVSKKVDKITFNLTAANTNILILSAIGEKPSVKDLINAVASTEVDAYTYESQLAMYNKIAQAINDNELNLQLADESLYAKYSQLEANIEAFEEIKPTLNPTATMDISYFKGSAPEVEVSIFNPSEVAGKAYKLIFAFYDSEENYLGAEILDKETTSDFNYSLEMKLSKDYSDAACVKGFMWKDFKTMKPLAEAKISEKKDTFKVLSIGNSFSQGVHTYLAEIAKNAGFEKVICGNLYIGGCYLDKHHTNIKNNKADYEFHIWELKDGNIVKNEDVTASTTILEGIKYTDWDVITLQQNSANSGNSSTYTYLDDILDHIHENKNEDTKVAWHMTWAYEEGSDILATYYPGKTQMGMYDAIVDVVNKKILPNDKIDFIIPAGTAVQNARKELGDIFNLSDGQHLKAMGYYLAGLTWLNKITGTDISGITYTPDSNTENILDTLKECAVNAVANPYSVTE